MSGWVAVPAVQSLRDAINRAFPDRDHGSDGTIGDAAHQGEVSDHNPDDTPGSRTEQTDADSIAEVRALDVDADLRAPGYTMADVVDAVLDRMRQLGGSAPLRYIIWDRHIYRRSAGWVAEAYAGSDPHTGHAHFDVLAGAGDAGNPEHYTGPWGVEHMGKNRRAVQLVEIDGHWPVLKQADQDPVDDRGILYVQRAQLLLGVYGQAVDVDGVYGPATAAAVKAMMASDGTRSSSNGAIIGEPEWRRLLGVWS